jgi:hypothetical protein
MINSLLSFFNIIIIDILKLLNQDKPWAVKMNPFKRRQGQ